MALESRYNLEEDIRNALLEYPKLEFFPPDLIKGTIEVSANGLHLHDFELKITIPREYPYCYPLVEEVGGYIQRTEDRHVYTNSPHLCLGVKAEELILCRFGQGLLWFLDKILVPRLAEEYLVVNGYEYLSEYSHGMEGPWEWYESRFDTKDRHTIFNLLNLVMTNNLPQGFEDCPCGSKRKFRRCHQKNVFQLQSEIAQINNPTFLKNELLRLSKSLSK